MRYLLDVNTLVAWGWEDHLDHERVDEWLADRLRMGNGELLTSAIPELGFVRVSVQRSGGQLTPQAASRVLAGMLERLRGLHQFLPDDLSARSWPAWCQGASQTADAHLLELATAHGAQLATLDKGIPGAFLIPERARGETETPSTKG
jgi:predicted nucleic acid-binding protein